MRKSIKTIAIGATMAFATAGVYDVSIPLADLTCSEGEPVIVSLEESLQTEKVRDGLLQYRDLNPQEKGQIKSCEVDKHITQMPRTLVTFSGVSYEIEIMDVQYVDGHVEALVRAWNTKGQQLGFGKRGDVEIERFRIFNPPVLVEDPKGTITREIVSIDTTGPVGSTVTTTVRYREDPITALKQVLVHNVAMTGKVGTKIEIGKVGNTVDTYYPNPSVETTSVDGYAYMDANNDTWANTRNAATGGGANDSATVVSIYVGNWLSGTNRYWIYRGAFLFDTSGITDSDTIDSATFSLWPTAITNDDLLLTNKSFRLVASTPASDTAIVAADYDQFGTTAGATADIAITSLSVGSYSMNYTLNATGLSWVSTTGITKLGVRHTADVLDEEPDAPGSADDYNYINVSSADTTGTTQDPKLVVTHTAGAPASTPVTSGLIKFE